MGQDGQDTQNIDALTKSVIGAAYRVHNTLGYGFLKSVSTLTVAHEVQLVNYLTATGIENGLLINFGPERVDVKRKYKTCRP